MNYCRQNCWVLILNPLECTNEYSGVYQIQARLHKFEIPLNIETSDDTNEMVIWMAGTLEKILAGEYKSEVPDWLLAGAQTEFRELLVFPIR